MEKYDSRQTRRAYRHDLEQFFDAEVVYLVDADRVEPDDIRTFLEREADSVGRQTLRRRATTLKAFFRWLTETERVPGNPFDELGEVSTLVDQALSSRDEHGDSGPSEATGDRDASPADEPTDTDHEPPTGSATDEDAQHDENVDETASPAALTADPARTRSGPPSTDIAPDDARRVPSWILDAADTVPADPPNLQDGERTTVAHLAPVVRNGLRSIVSQVPDDARHGAMSWSKPLLVRAEARPLTVQIRCVFGDDQGGGGGNRKNRVEIWLHDAGLQDMTDRGVGPSESTPPVPSHLIAFLRQTKWGLPDELHEWLQRATGRRLSPVGPTPKRDPLLIWTPPTSDEVQWQTAADVVAALHVGFELEKESKVVVRIDKRGLYR